jgi:hypothetical protein
MVRLLTDRGLSANQIRKLTTGGDVDAETFEILQDLAPLISAGGAGATRGFLME